MLQLACCCLIAALFSTTLCNTGLSLHKHSKSAAYACRRNQSIKANTSSIVTQETAICTSTKFIDRRPMCQRSVEYFKAKTERKTCYIFDLAVSSLANALMGSIIHEHHSHHLPGPDHLALDDSRSIVRCPPSLQTRSSNMQALKSPQFQCQSSSSRCRSSSRVTSRQLTPSTRNGEASPSAVASVNSLSLIIEADQTLYGATVAA